MHLYKTQVFLDNMLNQAAGDGDMQIVNQGSPIVKEIMQASGALVDLL